MARFRFGVYGDMFVASGAVRWAVVVSSLNPPRSEKEEANIYMKGEDDKHSRPKWEQLLYIDGVV